MTAAPAWLTTGTDHAIERLDERTWRLTSESGVIELALPHPRAVLVDVQQQEHGQQHHVLPSSDSITELTATGWAWLLPERVDDALPALHLLADDGAAASIAVVLGPAGARVTVTTGAVTLTEHAARPHADVAGGEIHLEIPDGDLLTRAFAGFYWDTMLPCVVERTIAADYPDSAGYVISTLADQYLGTYPDVDHEFQIKGRIAAGSPVDRDVVRRMIELQLRLMREDPQQLWRDPCAVQPDGDREYHVRRGSLDGSTNAVMFLVTGNIEVVESTWLYVARTSDLAWLAEIIGDLEGGTSCVEDLIDSQGRLWGDVYYEDQVIKDGRETMAQALAIGSFELLAQLEDLLGRSERSARYRASAQRLAAALRAPLPQGFWDPEHRRFTDWVDRSGVAHDHLHLLANELPVLVGAATAAQAGHVADLIRAEDGEYQRFPTFLAARIQDYTDSEIGDGGPYDLCAAGRYWCWDAAYRSWLGDGARLAQQLRQVAEQGASEDFVMGERYDLNHVYYVSDKPWHGAAHYYEYPCVFTRVLHHEYLGVRDALDVDLVIAPRLAAPGRVRLGQQAYRIDYSYAVERFELGNDGEARRFRLDLAALYPASGEVRVELAGGSSGPVPISDVVVELAAGERVVVVPV